MYSPDQQQYNQDVNINLQGEDNLSQVVDKVSDRIQGLQTKIAAANFGLGLFGKNVIKNSDNLEKFTKVLGSADKALTSAFNAATLAKVFTVLTTGIQSATNQLAGFNDGLKAMQATGYDTGIIDQFTQITDALTGSRAALDNFSLTSLTAFNRFNKIKTEVATLFKEGDEFVTQLSGNIQRLVNNDLKNAISSIDALSASYEAASSGFTDAADNQAVMTAGLKLAKAGGADTSATMKVLAQTISAYNLSASDATKVAAVLNQTVLSGVTTIPELSNGFAQAAVTANAAKIKLEDLGAAVAALTLQGFNTPGALTGIESLARVIISKTPQAEAALRELRDEAGKPIKFDINEIKTKGFAKALEDLNKAAKGNVEVLREIIPESQAYNTALALMSNNSEKLKEFSKTMFEVTKTGEIARKKLDEVFGIKINNQAEKFDQIVNRITEQFIQFGEQLAPFFDVGVVALENFTKMLAGISPEMKQTIATLLLAQLGIGRVTDAIGTLAGAALNAFGIYQGWRLTTMLMNGVWKEELTILQLLYKNNLFGLPIIKQLLGLDQSRLLVNAALTTSEADLIAKRAANTAATKLNTAAAVENAVAEGRLIQVNNALGVSYLKNNAIIKFFYQDWLSGIKQVGKGSADLLKMDVGSGLKKGLDVVVSGATKLGGLFTGASGAVGAIGSGLAALAAPLAAVALIGAVIYDQFVGTSAQVRQLEKDLKAINEQEKQSTLKTLEKLEGEKKLDYQQKIRLINMQNERDVVKENKEIYKGTYAEIGEALGKIVGLAGDFFNWINQINLPLIAIKELSKGIGAIWSNFRYDQMIGTFNEIDAAVQKTDSSIIDLIKSSNSLKQGFTGLADIDKLIKEGKILDSNAIQKIKNKVEQDSKLVDGQVANNEKRIETLNKQLESFDKLNADEQKNASAADKRLAEERNRLSARNDMLREKSAELKEIGKAEIEFALQRNVLLKRIQDNEFKVDKNDKSNTTTDADVEGSVNAIQVRLKKGLRLASADLDLYRKQVKATLDGSNEYLDENGKKVKLDVTNLTQYVQQYDNLVQQKIGSVDALYQNSYVNGKEAAEQIKKILTDEGKLLDSSAQIALINQAVSYAKEGSKEQIELLNTQSEIAQALNDAGVKSTRETAQEIRKIQSAQLELQINDMKAAIELQLKTAPILAKQMQAQLELLQAKQRANNLNNTKAELEDRFKEQQAGLNKEEAIFKLRRAKYTDSEEETIRQSEALNKKQLLNQQANLTKQLELVGNDKEKKIQIETELLNVQLQYQQIVTEALNREFEKRNKKLQNEATRTTQQYREQINTLNNINSSREEENKIYESRNRLIASASQFEEVRLQNQLKLTGDIQKRADIEVQIDEIKQKNLIVQQKIEQESYEYQQETIKLALQRQEIELNIRKIDNETNRKILQLELERAIKQKINKEDQEIIKLKLEANEEESRNLNASVELLEKSNKNQIEIATNSKKELEYKQQIAREGGLLDSQIVKQNQILAGYEKQAKSAQLEATISELDSKKKITASEVLTKSYQLRLDLAQKQLDMEQASQDGIQRQFKMAEDLTLTDYQKRSLAEAAAKQELLSLKKKQELEQQMLDMQIKSNELAYQRQLIEQESAKVRLSAELKVAEAEDKKVQMSKTATAEDKAASAATVDAKRFAVQAQGYEDYFLQERGKMLKIEEQSSRFNLATKQRNEEQAKQIAYAKSTFSTGDDNAIYKAIKDSLKPLTDGLSGVQINNSQARLGSLFSLQTPNFQIPNSPGDINLSAPTINATGARNNIVPTNPSAAKAPVNVTLNVTNDVRVEGGGDTKDIVSKMKDVNAEVTRHLYNIIRTTNTEMGN